LQDHGSAASCWKSELVPGREWSDCPGSSKLNQPLRAKPEYADRPRNERLEDSADKRDHTSRGAFFAEFHEGLSSSGLHARAEVALRLRRQLGDSRTLQKAKDGRF